MNWMRPISKERCLVGEFHRAAKFVTLAARRSILADPRFQQAGNLALQLANFSEDMLLLLGGDGGLKSKCKHVDVHGWHPIRKGTVDGIINQRDPAARRKCPRRRLTV